MPRTCRFTGNYNVAKKLKKDTKTIMTNRKIRRSQLKKDQTRRRKNRKPVVSRWTMDKLGEMARTIMQLGSKYAKVIYDLVQTYDEWIDEIYSLKYLEPKTLEHLDTLLNQLVKEKEMNLGKKYRIRATSFINTAPESLFPLIEQIYKKHIRKRFNQYTFVDMDLKFPFPLKGIQEMEKLIKKEKQHEYYMKRKTKNTNSV